MMLPNISRCLLPGWYARLRWWASVGCLLLAMSVLLLHPLARYLVRGHVVPSVAGRAPHWVPRDDAMRPKLVLYWTTKYGMKDFYFGFGQRPFQNCPVSHCVTTSDRSRLTDADAVFFHGQSISLTDLPTRRRPEQRFVFNLAESPQMTTLNLARFDMFFNWTMTYHRGADIWYPYAATTTGRQTEPIPPFENRTRLVAWMVSHCGAPSGRDEYVRRLQRHLSVDVSGKCGRQRCHLPVDRCYRRMAESHLFYLSFENSLCEDYVTEKFWLALRAGMVPVVRGTDRDAYRRVAPPDSFIHVSDFATPGRLAEFLHSLAANRSAYEEFHAWRATHRVHYPNPMCRVCEKLWAGELTRCQVKLTEAWSAERYCASPSDITDDE